MCKPAARVTDPMQPPHVPGLIPGVGALTVLIGGMPAWRANIDVAVCACPIAPPAPAPHGPEICYLGSLSVMIGGQMAARMGDKLVGAGGPGIILSGWPTVLIGDMGFGLANPANMAEFCADFAQLMSEWGSLTPAQREARLAEISNRQLAKSGVSPVSVRGTAEHQPGNAVFDFPSDTVEVSQTLINSPNLSPQQARSLANNVYHESRHAEQWNLMARHAAAQGQTAGQIQTNLGVTPAAAQAAAGNPLSGTSAATNLGQAGYDSVYGTRGDYRNDVLDNVQSRYQEYRALPEEQDAWRTGDSLPCGAP